MADSKLSDLTDMGAAPARNDVLYVVDTSTGLGRKVQVKDLFSFFDIVIYCGDVVTHEGNVVYSGG